MDRKPLKEAALEYREAAIAFHTAFPVQGLVCLGSAEFKRLSVAHADLKDAACAECYECGGDNPNCRCWDDS